MLTPIFSVFLEERPTPDTPTPSPDVTTRRPSGVWPNLPDFGVSDDKIFVYDGDAWSTYDFSQFPEDFLG